MATDRLNQHVFRVVNAARDLQRAQLVVQASRQLSPENRQMLSVKWHERLHLIRGSKAWT